MGANETMRQDRPRVRATFHVAIKIATDFHGIRFRRHERPDESQRYEGFCTDGML
jgi:hypothetical protein